MSTFGTKRTFTDWVPMSVFDPKQTSRFERTSLGEPTKQKYLRETPLRLKIA